MLLPDGNVILSTCGLIFSQRYFRQVFDLNLTVEMADVADDRHVLHLPHVPFVMTSQQPVAVTNISPIEAASSMVMTSYPPWMPEEHKSDLSQ